MGLLNIFKKMLWKNACIVIDHFYLKEWKVIVKFVPKTSLLIIWMIKKLVRENNLIFKNTIQRNQNWLNVIFVRDRLIVTELKNIKQHVLKTKKLTKKDKGDYKGKNLTKIL